MSSPLSTNALLARHKAYLPSHRPIPTLTELTSLGAAISPVAVVTCTDPRCIPENFLGLHTGEVLAIRNAGGNIEMAIPNLLALDCLLDFKEIMVVKHTDCGSLAYTTAGVKGGLNGRAPGRREEIEKMELGSIAGKTLEQGLKEQVAVVKASELLREELKQNIRAFIFDISSGELTEVKV